MKRTLLAIVCAVFIAGSPAFSADYDGGGGNGGGSGDVTGPASSTDNAIPCFSGTGGKTLKACTDAVMTSAITLTDPGTKGTCDVNARFKTHTDAGGAGVADTFEICTKDGADAYDWRDVLGGSSDPITGATDNRLVRADGTNALQDSGITIDDTDAVTGVASINGNDLTPGTGSYAASFSGNDNRLLRADGTTGIQESGITVDDSDNLSGIGTIGSGAITSTGAISGTTGTFSAEIAADGGIDIGDAGAQPTCDASERGTVWVDEGGAGVADITEICHKNSGDTYEWKDMIGAGGSFDGDLATDTALIDSSDNIVDIADSILLVESLVAATGNETILDLDITCNKATSGDCNAGLDINVTNTASPGELTFLKFGIGGTYGLIIDEGGTSADNFISIDSDFDNDVQIEIGSSSGYPIMRFSNHVGTDVGTITVAGTDLWRIQAQTNADMHIFAAGDSILELDFGGGITIDATADGATDATLGEHGTNGLSIISGGGGVRLDVQNGAAPAATCTVGEIFIDTDETDDTNCTTTADNSLCLCTATNTWTALENN